MFCLFNFIFTLTFSKTFNEILILIVEIKNIVVGIVENIVAFSISHFVLFNFLIIDKSINIDFNIIKIDCCVKKSISLCFFVFLTLLIIDINVNINFNLNIIKNDYCIKKTILTFSIIDIFFLLRS